MPLPPFLFSVSAFLCERILHEADGVLSAIRIVDVFYVELPTNAPEGAVALIQPHCLVIFKTQPGHHGEHSMAFKMLNTKGELTSIGEAMRTDFGARSGLGKDIPGGANVAIQLNVAVKNYGTCYLCVYFDDEEIARVPFTILLKPTEKKD
jgi:hypothetical protein